MLLPPFGVPHCLAVRCKRKTRQLASSGASCAVVPLQTRAKSQ